MMIQLAAAFLGTVAFALLFGVPKQHYLSCGLIGLAGWGVYLALTGLTLTPAEAAFVATAVVALLSRLAAVRKKCPATVFSICGIFPIIPGGTIYRCIYAAVTGNGAAAGAAGILAAKVLFGMVVGMVLVQDLGPMLQRGLKNHTEEKHVRS